MKAVLIVLCVLAVSSAKKYKVFQPGKELIKQQDEEMTSRVVGGSNTNINQHPWQASLRRYSSHICGASIISSEWLITAAHCVDGSSAGILSIGVGSSNRLSMTNYAVAQIISHPNWNPNGNGLPNDIALIRVSSPISFGSSVEAISIDGSFSSSDCHITGWGRTSGTSSSLPSTLQVAYMPVITNNQCSGYWGNVSGATTLSSHVCIYEYGKSACNGDSGGPLVCSGVLVGATSWGVSGCPGTYPSVYTRISSFRSWIRTNSGV